MATWAEAAPPPAAGSTIFVVHDDPGVLLLLLRVLEAEGYTVVVAESARDALVVLEHLRVDLLLIDPEEPGMDAEAPTTMVQRLPDPSRVLLLSNYRHPASPRGSARPAFRIGALLTVISTALA